MALPTGTPEANYFARNNIVVPVHIPAAEIAAMETRARADIAARSGGGAVTGGSIKKANK
jgi:hypothetical protein